MRHMPSSSGLFPAVSVARGDLRRHLLRSLSHRSHCLRCPEAWTTAAERVSPCLYASKSLCLHVSVSSRLQSLRAAVLSCLRITMRPSTSPCLHISMSPCVYASKSACLLVSVSIGAGLGKALEVQSLDQQEILLGSTVPRFPELLKIGRCSGLDAWIVPAFSSGLSPNRALK